MVRRKMIDGKLVEVASVSGRFSSAARTRPVNKEEESKRHTVNDAEAEDSIFKELLNKRKEE